MDDAAKKTALRLFTYGLYAVTVGTGDDLNGFTANWLSQVSFDPPLVVVSVQNDSFSLPVIERTGLFAVNVFSADQRELSGRLGKPRARAPEKLAGLDVETGETGVPLLKDAIASVECRVEGQMLAGDSTLVLGRVVGAVVRAEGDPLTMRAAGFKHAG
ncbi:MAG TPA: flavin reductase family protein [Ktedonobacterales bacterium]|jgi:flavin reductase (DIM6/NTAB) family NADH-FMN oxidoreductase RutF